MSGTNLHSIVSVHCWRCCSLLAEHLRPRGQRSVVQAFSQYTPISRLFMYRVAYCRRQVRPHTKAMLVNVPWRKMIHLSCFPSNAGIASLSLPKTTFSRAASSCSYDCAGSMVDGGVSARGAQPGSFPLTWRPFFNSRMYINAFKIWCELSSQLVGIMSPPHRSPSLPSCRPQVHSRLPWAASILEGSP